MNNYYQYNGSSLYGNYRTRTFADIFYGMDPETSTAANFQTSWNESPFAKALPDQLNAELIFYLLYARYANSTVASSDEDRFIYQLHSIIFQYGPTWTKELQVQNELRAMNIADFQKGSKSTVNHASNPSTAPSTIDTEELPYVGEQNVSKVERSKADGYALMLSLLKEDVTEKFLRRFEKLFLVIVEPERPLWYETYPESEV